MTYGTLTPPLGTTKLNIIKLIAKLISTNNAKLFEEIIHYNILNTIFVSAFNYESFLSIVYVISYLLIDC